MNYIFLVACFVVLGIFPLQNSLNNCPPEGTATAPGEQEINRLKNRIAVPLPQAFNKSVTFAEMIRSGEDVTRFSNMQAAEISGYVYDVRSGDIESCNCDSKEIKFKDTIIELVDNLSKNENPKKVIVEITPRWREMMEKKNMVWSTNALRSRLMGKFVKVQGWLLFDAETRGEADNTNPKGKKNSRATSWEIHPVTSIEVMQVRTGKLIR